MFYGCCGSHPAKPRTPTGFTSKCWWMWTGMAVMRWSSCGRSAAPAMTRSPSSPSWLKGRIDLQGYVTNPDDPTTNLHLMHNQESNQPESGQGDRKSTRLNSSHLGISYAV